MPQIHGRISADTGEDKGRHYEFIKSRIHPTFKGASRQRIHELSLTKNTSGQWTKISRSF